MNQFDLNSIDNRDDLEAAQGHDEFKGIFYKLADNVFCEKFKENYLLFNRNNCQFMCTQGLETRIVDGFLQGKEYFDIIEDIYQSNGLKIKKIELTIYVECFINKLIKKEMILNIE